MSEKEKHEKELAEYKRLLQELGYVPTTKGEAVTSSFLLSSP